LRVTGVDDGPPITLSAPVDARPVDGPAVVDLGDATLLVPEGWCARPGAAGGYVMERSE
jgi:hypothetical protein